jgi:hypothetical protein
MNPHLKQAIAAAHAGKKPQAKVLLARVIKDEPENANAWFLLSSLADTDEQKIQHLQKVLELQPNHPTAADQLAKLVPTPPEPVEELAREPIIDDSFEEPSEDDGTVTNIFPLPQIDVPEVDEPEVDQPVVEVPDDPEEAMAWLEQLAANQGASLDELPSLSEMRVKKELEPEPESIETFEPESDAFSAYDSDVPEDSDDAMAWLEELAADQGEPFDELPTMGGDPMADTITGLGDDFSWLDDDISEDDDFPEPLESMMDEEEVEVEEPAKTMKISKDLDFVDQAKADSIPAWLADDEELILADTVMAQTPVDEYEPEPENLPDWLTDESLEGWSGDEGEKSGQVVWKPGEGDDSKRPTPPPSEKKASPTPAQKTAAPKDNSGFYVALLGVTVVVLILAILYVLIYQPF